MDKWCNMQNKMYLDYLDAEMRIFSNNFKKMEAIDLKTLEKIIELKRFYQSILIQNYHKKNYMVRNTNINHKVVKEGIFKFEYDYQRYDIKIFQSNYLKFFYNFSANHYYYFTNCGMSALFATFYAFKKNNYQIDRLGNIYVEIERMLDDYTLTPNKCIGKVLYIDSTSFIDIKPLLKDNDLSDYGAFIFDTTDYLEDDSLPIIKKLLKYNKPIYLVRSHIKLDMLGSEWNKLGSICVINSKNISKASKQLSKKIKQEIYTILSIIGGFAYPENMPLIWNDSKFKMVNKRRIEIIRKNSQYLYDKLLEVFDKKEICYPYHKMFVLLRINHKLNFEEVDAEIDKYIKKSKYKGLINFSDSFGLDYYALCNYWETMEDKYPDIRIVVPDYPEEINKIIVDDLIIWLKKFYKKFN